ncbi:hypothetical protein M917_2281 [Psychrobacter aquaticus CMS 56]|uniref:Uncharacterized protein n=1 Tax=Psychrobacter aquaticus CMS 56 TaxID=1354303 RepID=U4T2U1_9GAMM|nr:hypothetical protein M917_2281 [Psychrobacter aquaticus CMS 56]
MIDVTTLMLLQSLENNIEYAHYIYLILDVKKPQKRGGI